MEREQRRKRQIPAYLSLGHIVNNYMTVIIIDGALSGNYRFVFITELFLGAASSVPFFIIMQEVRIWRFLKAQV